MNYTEIKGYSIPKLTLGTVALGQDYGISNAEGKPVKEKSFEIFSTALSLGINTFDTARIYGDAESLIGNFLSHDENKPKTNLITKFGIKDDNLVNLETARKQVYESIRSSCYFLNLKQIPICLFHKANGQNMDILMEILPVIFEDLKNDGLIDLAGISIYNPYEEEIFLEHPLFEAYQVPVNVFDQRIIQNGMLKQMQQENKIVFARSVYLQGLFFLSPDELKGNLVNARPYILALQDLAKQAGMSIAELAFSYVRDLEEVTSIVFGATTELQVQENVKLLFVRKIPFEVRQSIESLFNNMPSEIITPGLWIS
ncbi:MAG TPA: aldo/keto reductase [Daejeonella sp.]|uniref:aldo/keto reductase n=1 Tax=Daejeonella sp. TaxID=2805397 RepID=UPI002ED78EC9